MLPPTRRGNRRGKPARRWQHFATGGPPAYELSFQTCDGFSVARLPRPLTLPLVYAESNYPEVAEPALKLAVLEPLSQQWMAVPGPTDRPGANVVSVKIDVPGIYSVQASPVPAAR